jgi:DNA-binding transcriptional ArsR family regulator
MILKAAVTTTPSPDSADHGHPERLVNPEQVARVRAAMPTPEDVADLADVFSLLGEPGRVRILIALLPGRMSVRDLAAVVEMSESGASHALRLLRAHRVVDVHREGRVAYYALADSHVRALIDLALEHVGHTVLLHTTPEHHDTPGDPACLTTTHPAPAPGGDSA